MSADRTRVCIANHSAEIVEMVPAWSVLGWPLRVIHGATVLNDRAHVILALCPMSSCDDALCPMLPLVHQADLSLATIVANCAGVQNHAPDRFSSTIVPCIIPMFNSVCIAIRKLRHSDVRTHLQVGPHKQSAQSVSKACSAPKAKGKLMSQGFWNQCTHCKTCHRISQTPRSAKLLERSGD